MRNLIFIFLGVFLACSFGKSSENVNQQQPTPTMDTLQQTDTAILGAGCFWCVEAVFQRIEGVIKVESGYAGGHVKNPPYREVCEGTTGHAEVCRIIFDPNKVSFETLLSVFFQTHDPTTLNRQGNDIGTQYRSAIFYLNEAQKNTATQVKNKLDAEQVFANPIVTEITAFTNYYPAEDYHQNYYNQNSDQPYCKFVVAPKVEKLKKVFGNSLLLKKDL